tara:strand:- start:187 stop:441 length:255 start_codon:yes stop_codon:yes gene_type:complete
MATLLTANVSFTNKPTVIYDGGIREYGSTEGSYWYWFVNILDDKAKHKERYVNSMKFESYTEAYTDLLEKHPEIADCTFDEVDY